MCAHEENYGYFIFWGLGGNWAIGPNVNEKVIAFLIQINKHMNLLVLF